MRAPSRWFARRFVGVRRPRGGCAGPPPLHRRGGVRARQTRLGQRALSTSIAVGTRLVQLALRNLTVSTRFGQ